MLRKIFSAFRNPAQYRTPLYPISVRCSRCGEVISARVNLHHDLSLLDEAGPGGSAYLSRKTLVGSGRCFQRIEVELYFNRDRRLVYHEIRGGELLSHGQG